MNIPEIKECIKGQVSFKKYKDNTLWYECENYFLFPVPIDDIGDATFIDRDKAILFMRYIRKYIDELKKTEEPKVE